MRQPNMNIAPMYVDNDIYQGISLEREIEMAETAKQPIESTSPMLYTERKKGVLAETNPRTDRWDVAENLMDKASKATTAKRAEFIKTLDEGAKAGGSETAEA